MVRILGIDPGLNNTGWGVIDYVDNTLICVNFGVIKTSVRDPIHLRLAKIHKSLTTILENLKPNQAAVENIFVNSNSMSSLKLGLARGVALCVPAIFEKEVFEYTANCVKKSVVGVGHADKNQVSIMVQKLLGCGEVKLDAADALAVAICHAHHSNALYLRT